MSMNRAVCSFLPLACSIAFITSTEAFFSDSPTPSRPTTETVAQLSGNDHLLGSRRRMISI